MLLIISASGTAPDLAPVEVSGAVQTATTTAPTSTTTTTTTTTTTPASPASPETTAVAAAPTVPPTAPPSPGTATIRIRYDEPPCGQATSSATGCARGAGSIGVVTGSGAPGTIGPVRTVGAGVRELTAVLEVRAAATTWDLVARLDYVGPCGAAGVDTVRYRVVVSSDGDVLLLGVNGATGSLRRPQPTDRTWLATIQPYRFPAPEPGCA